VRDQIAALLEAAHDVTAVADHKSAGRFEMEALERGSCDGEALENC